MIEIYIGVIFYMQWNALLVPETLNWSKVRSGSIYLFICVCIYIDELEPPNVPPLMELGYIYIYIYIYIYRQHLRTKRLKRLFSKNWDVEFLLLCICLYQYNIGTSLRGPLKLCFEGTNLYLGWFLGTKVSTFNWKIVNVWRTTVIKLHLFANQTNKKLLNVRNNRRGYYWYISL